MDLVFFFSFLLIVVSSGFWYLLRSFYVHFKSLILPWFTKFFLRFGSAILQNRLISSEWLVTNIMFASIYRKRKQTIPGLSFNILVCLYDQNEVCHLLKDILFLKQIRLTAHKGLCDFRLASKCLWSNEVKQSKWRHLYDRNKFFFHNICYFNGVSQSVTFRISFYLQSFG